MRERKDREPSSRLAAWYRRAAVRSRIAEYCGGSMAPPAASCVHPIAGYGGVRRLSEPDGGPVAGPASMVGALFAQGADVCRSLADNQGTLFHLDLDYTSPSDPSEPFRRPQRVFARLEPVYRDALERLARYSVHPLSLMTARGYHLVFRVRRGSPFHRSLCEIGMVNESLRARYGRQEGGLPGALDMGRAHEGAGRLAEHLGHEMLYGLRGRTTVPVTLADVPPSGRGPFICLDLSAYGDPLFGRYIRCAFSSNQKAWMGGLVPQRPFVLVLPRRRSYAEVLEAREDPAAAARLARVENAAIPNAPAECLAWVNDYRGSALARFHDAFERGPQMQRADWPYSYDSLDLRAFPECVRRALETPNPTLLAPVFLRTVTLALWALGWHPRSVAGLIRSRFEANHGWSGYWSRYDAAARAEFYVRVLSGAVAAGLDAPSDFTCESQALRGACAQQACGHDLGALFPDITRDRPRGAWRRERRPV